MHTTGTDIPAAVGTSGRRDRWSRRRRRSAARTDGMTSRQRTLKRAFDVVVALVLFCVLLPLMAVIALAVVLDSPGPVLYRCERIGQRGRRFAVLKFRKMYDDDQGLPVSTASDPRYTRLGRWLARAKLDELPQLWNVLIGEMSLVGPRPEDPAFVAERRRDYETILAVKQGITGLSQLAFFDEAGILDPDDPITDYRARIWPQKIALDHMYVERATLAWDLRILYWTVASVLLRRPVAVHRSTGRIGLRRRPALYGARAGVSVAASGVGGALAGPADAELTPPRVAA